MSHPTNTQVSIQYIMKNLLEVGDACWAEFQTSFPDKTVTGTHSCLDVFSTDVESWARIYLTTQYVYVYWCYHFRFCSSWPQDCLTLKSNVGLGCSLLISRHGSYSKFIISFVLLESRPVEETCSVAQR